MKKEYLKILEKCDETNEVVLFEVNIGCRSTNWVFATAPKKVQENFLKLRRDIISFINDEELGAYIHVDEIPNSNNSEWESFDVTGPEDFYLHSPGLINSIDKLVEEYSESISEELKLGSFIKRKADTFNTIFSDYENYNGSKFEIIRLCTKDEVDIEDVGDMIKIRFEDGKEIDAYPEEVLKGE